MKKQFLRCMSGLIPAIALFSNLNGQPAKARLQFNLNETAFNEALTQPVIPSENKTANINPRALRDFNKSFKDTDAEKADWRQIKDGFIAEFENNGVKTKVYYNRKGSWCSTLLTYDQYKLPEDVRRMVRINYYDYEIYVAYEVHIEDKTIYLVKIQDRETLKTIRIIDGDMDLYEDYKKFEQLAPRK
jgi:hypothetical protein